MPTNEQNGQNERNDDWEEFGQDMGMPEEGRATISEWVDGAVGKCTFCDLEGGIPEQCRREDGTAGCPRCGGNIVFYQDIQGMQTARIDLAQGWRPGQTGRCGECGLIARVFDDVRQEDGTAACEMCGVGTFEFVYGLPDSATRAPAPRPDYVHEIDGMTLNLRRRFEPETLRLALDLFREGKTAEEILNTQDNELGEILRASRVTKHSLDDIKKAENKRRWENHEPLLYTTDELERLGGFTMLRVPFHGRMKIIFAGLRGPIERWVKPETFTQITTGNRVLIFDGHYKAIEASRILEEPRFEMAKQFFPKINAFLGRGLVRAVSVTGEDIPIEGGNWEDTTPDRPEPSDED